MGLTVGGFPFKTANLKFDDAIAQLVSGEDLPSLQTVLEKIDQRLDLTRINLTALLDLYVDPVLGTDSPEKGSATGADAYATLNYALAEVLRNFNPNGNIIRFNISAGTHVFDQQTILLELGGSDANFCDIVIRGVSAAQTIIQCNTPNLPLFVSRSSSSRYCFRALTFEGLASGSTHILEVREGSYFDFDFCNIIGTFPANNLASLVVSTNGNLRAANLNYGDLNTSALIFAGNSGKLDLAGNINALDNTTSNFTEGFLKVLSSSVFKAETASFSGSGTVTGKKYVINDQADFEFGGELIADLEQLPGDQPGEFIAVAQYAIKKYGEDVYTDYSLGANGMVVSRFPRTDGAGSSLAPETGALKRYNGLAQNEFAGFARGLGILIIDADFSCAATTTPTGSLQFSHTALDSTDEQILTNMPINQQNSLRGSLRNVKLYVPPNRRLTLYLNGSYDFPQLIFSYRHVFEVL